MDKDRNMNDRNMNDIWRFWGYWGDFLGIFGDFVELGFFSIYICHHLPTETTDGRLLLLPNFLENNFPPVPPVPIPRSFQFPLIYLPQQRTDDLFQSGQL